MSGGYLTFGSRYLSDPPYLDGVTWDEHQVPIGMAWDAQADGLVLRIPTLAGTDILQRRAYYGSISDLPLRWQFVLPVQAYDEEEFFRLHRVLAKGEAVYFVPGIWLEEVFSGVSDGDSVLLNRPLADGIHPDVSSATHPVRYFFDDVENETAATVTGTPAQTVEVSGVGGTPGDLAVRYMPAFRVVPSQFSGNVADVNALNVSLHLQEVVTRG